MGAARRCESRSALGEQRRSAEALAAFPPVYDRFTEEFDTADLKAAKTLLDALQGVGIYH